jgi:hypothetical protein
VLDMSCGAEWVRDGAGSGSESESD